MGEMLNELIGEAKETGVKFGFISIALLQRKMRIGYVDASRLIDILVNNGFCEAECDVYGHRKINPSTVWVDQEPAAKLGTGG